MSQPVRVAASIRVAIGTLCLAVHGCANVTGGAVELSWKLRASSGSTSNFIDCDSGVAGTGPVKSIRLYWETPGQDPDYAQWRCDDGHGVTGFELPPPDALLYVVPVCARDVAATGTYTAPAPEERRVIVGNTISLGAVELVLQVSSCGLQPCICQ